MGTVTTEVITTLLDSEDPAARQFGEGLERLAGFRELLRKSRALLSDLAAGKLLPCAGEEQVIQQLETWHDEAQHLADQLIVALEKRKAITFAEQVDRFLTEATWHEWLESLEKEGVLSIQDKRKAKRLAAQHRKQLIEQLSRMRDKTLSDDAAASDGTERFAEFYALVDKIEWEALPEICASLERKKNAQLTCIQGYKDLITRFESEEVARLDSAIELGSRYDAPVRAEQALLEELRSLIAQARREIDGRFYSELAASLNRIRDDEPARARDATAKVDRKCHETRAIAPAAELLLLHTRPLIEAEDNDQSMAYEQYTVMLRTAGDPGKLATNRQDESKVAKEDRTRVLNLIQTINGRLTGKWLGLRTGNPVSDAVVPPLPAPPDLSVLSALRAGSFGAPEVTPGAVPESFIDDLGELLCLLFVPDGMQPFFAEEPFSLTLTTNDLELPWELMRYRDGSGAPRTLALEHPVARMPLGFTSPRREAPVALHDAALVAAPSRPPGDVRILLIYSDPTSNLPDADREITAIKKGLDAFTAAVAPRLKVTTDTLGESGRAVTGNDLNEVLRADAYDIIHYAGHAVYNAKEPDLSALILKDGESFYAQKIKRILRGHPLVFLNACQSGLTRNESNEDSVVLRNRIGRSAARTPEGLASAFIYGGALGCIGTLWPVFDSAAADFAVEFYQYVIEGYRIGEAMRLARRAARDRAHQQNVDDLTWASFILYGDPGLILGKDRR